MPLKEHTNLPSWCWSWLCCCDLWLRYFTISALELWNCLQTGPNYHHDWPKNSERRHNPLEVCLWKNIQTCQHSLGLGCVVAAQFSIICPAMFFLARISYEMARLRLNLGNSRFGLAEDLHNTVRQRWT
jgi:hypothetical protein